MKAIVADIRRIKIADNIAGRTKSLESMAYIGEAAGGLIGQ